MVSWLSKQQLGTTLDLAFPIFMWLGACDFQCLSQESMSQDYVLITFWHSIRATYWNLQTKNQCHTHVMTKKIVDDFQTLNNYHAQHKMEDILLQTFKARYVLLFYKLVWFLIKHEQLKYMLYESPGPQTLLKCKSFHTTFNSHVAIWPRYKYHIGGLYAVNSRLSATWPLLNTCHADTCNKPTSYSLCT